MRANQRQRRHRQPEPHQGYAPQSKIHIRNLPADITQTELFNLFKQFGDVLDAYSKQPPPTDVRTYGFVRFVSIHQAASAIRACNATIRFGRRIYVAFAKSKINLKKSRNNYSSSNLDTSMTMDSNSCCCSCHSQAPIRSKKSSVPWPEAKYRTRQELLISKKQKYTENSVNISPKFSSEDENIELKEKRKAEENEREKERKKKREKKQKEKEVRLEEKEVERPKPEPKVKAKRKEEKQGHGLLAISTDISKSQASEDYYSYEAKPFSDFCLKREEL